MPALRADSVPRLISDPISPPTSAVLLHVDPPSNHRYQLLSKAPEHSKAQNGHPWETSACLPGKHSRHLFSCRQRILHSPVLMPRRPKLSLTHSRGGMTLPHWKIGSLAFQSTPSWRTRGQSLEAHWLFSWQFQVRRRGDWMK